MKKVIFTFQGELLHEAQAAELDTETIIAYKSALAASRGINSDLIEVFNEEVPDCSDSFVRYDGALMYQPKGKTYPVYVNYPAPAMDIAKEELFMEFLDLISNKKFEEALTFLN